MKDAPRLCIHCAHHSFRVTPVARHECVRRPDPPIDLVTGREVYPLCADERADGARCGPRGICWSSKEAP